MSSAICLGSKIEFGRILDPSGLKDRQIFLTNSRSSIEAEESLFLGLGVDHHLRWNSSYLLISSGYASVANREMSLSLSDEFLSDIAAVMSLNVIFFQKSHRFFELGAELGYSIHEGKKNNFVVSSGGSERMNQLDNIRSMFFYPALHVVEKSGRRTVFRVLFDKKHFELFKHRSYSSYGLMDLGRLGWECFYHIPDFKNKYGEFNLGLEKRDFRFNEYWYDYQFRRLWFYYKMKVQEDFAVEIELSHYHLQFQYPDLKDESCHTDRRAIETDRGGSSNLCSQKMNPRMFELAAVYSFYPGASLAAGFVSEGRFTDSFDDSPRWSFNLKAVLEIESSLKNAEELDSIKYWARRKLTKNDLRI